MSKLYISYYGDYVSIVEGTYNTKTKKYVVEESMFVPLLQDDETGDREEQKYNSFKRALTAKNFKSKKVVLCLSNNDIIAKNIKIPKVSPKDLNSIMNMEMDDIISLDRDEYVLSYEVLDEIEEDENKMLDILVAAAKKDKVSEILDILDKCKLQLESVDILPNSYIKFLKQIDYKDIMIVNSGPYGTMIAIYKEDSLFIYDYIPIKIDDTFDYMKSLALVDEAKGLINYYSSRNFGKVVDSIVLLGEGANNPDIKRAFEYSFQSEVIFGIDKLYDIKEDIENIFNIPDASLYVENLGMMLRGIDKRAYAEMNLIPDEMKSKQRKKKIAAQALAMTPIVLALMLSPYMIFGLLNKSNTQKLEELKDEIAIAKEDAKEADDLQERINLKKKELEQYDILLENQISWGRILSDIDKAIPYRAELTNLSFKYEANSKKDSQDKKDTENTQAKNNNEQNTNNQDTVTTEADKEIPIYKQIPNVVTIEGRARTSDLVGKFVYGLNKLEYFESVKLDNITKDKTGQKFSIKGYMKEGAIIHE
jgi:Tfp pilus assembly PilM family ATPase/Tfp pilus assembly protein PilN